MRPRYVALWVTLAVLAAITEAVALLDPQPGDTLSEGVRTLVTYAPELGGAVLIGGAGWFCWHILRKVR